MDTEHYKNIILSFLENDAFYDKFIKYKQQKKTLKNVASLLLKHGKKPDKKRNRLRHEL